MRVALLVLALVAAASAACIGAGFATAYQLGTGITPVNVPADAVQVVAKLPVCKDAFPAVSGGFQTCCGPEAFDKIRQLGTEYSNAISAVSDNLDLLKQYRNKVDDAVDQACRSLPPAICDSYKKAIAAFKQFLNDLPSAYRQCSAGYRDYLEGAFCAICHPDFFPNIAVQEGSTVTFTWSSATCDDLNGACSHLIEVIVNFAVEFTEALSITDSFDMLNGVPGSTVAERIRNFLCYTHIRGVTTIDFSGAGAFVTAFGTWNVGGNIGGRRDHIQELRDAGSKALRQMFSKNLSLRQSAGGNAYNGTYNPVQVGKSNNFISSATTATFSMAALLLAIIGLFLF